MKKVMMFCLVSMACTTTVACNKERRTSDSTKISVQVSLNRSTVIPIPVTEATSKGSSVTGATSEEFSPNTYYNSSCYCAWADNSPASKSAFKSVIEPVSNR